MKQQNENNSSTKKGLRILLPVLLLALVAGAIIAFLLKSWALFIVVLAIGFLLTASITIRPRTVGARFDPLVEGGEGKRGADMEHRPEDVTLNPWDQLTGSGEQPENT